MRDLLGSDKRAGIFPTTTPWFLLHVSMVNPQRTKHEAVVKLASMLGVPTVSPPDLFHFLPTWISYATRLLPSNHLLSDWEARLDDLPQQTSPPCRWPSSSSRLESTLSR